MNRLLAAVMVVATGCGVSESAVEASEVGTEDGAELSTVSRSYVVVRRDFRKCAWPHCGGWWVQDVNRVNPTERYVYELDFSTSGLDQATVDQALEGAAASEVVLRGKLGPANSFNTRPFVVSDAWRGMPGMAPAAGEKFYSVESLDIQCFAAPCATYAWRKLNYTPTTGFHGLKVDRAAKHFVDQEWLTDRVAEHGALVAAKQVNGRSYPAGREKLLDASQVYVKLPEAPGPCPVFKLAACPDGQTRTYARTADRCVVPDACVTGGACALFIPSCDEGYQLTSWTAGQFACQAWACDPTFTLPAAPEDQ